MRRLFTLFACFLLVCAAHARDTCSSPAGPQDIFACAIDHHPDVLRLEAEAANLDAFQILARQRPNPDVDSEVLSNSAEDEPSLSVRAGYGHTVELGGKRSIRRERANAQREAVLFRLEWAKEEAALKTVLNLHRLQQIESELETIQEALDTFGKIVTQYRGRRQLSPEQDVSLNVFILAQGDYTLRKSVLLQEQRSLKAYFDLVTGADFQTVLQCLPPGKPAWPDISGSTGSTRLGGALVKEADAQVSIAKADVRVAGSEAWPDLKVGPVLEIDSGRGENNQGIGGALSLGLPLYQRNQGAKAVAANELQRAEVNLTQTAREAQADWLSWRDNYRSSVASLKEMPTVTQMEKKHKSIESLFERGLIESSLIIEAHRQMADFTKSLHEQELRAIEALWSIYRLEGRILKETL